MTVFNVCDRFACMFASSTPDGCGDQKKLSDLLELDLKMVLSHPVVLGIKPGSSHVLSKCFTTELKFEACLGNMRPCLRQK